MGSYRWAKHCSDSAEVTCLCNFASEVFIFLEDIVPFASSTNTSSNGNGRPSHSYRFYLGLLIEGALLQHLSLTERYLPLEEKIKVLQYCVGALQEDICYL